MPSTDVQTARQANCPTCGAKLPDRPFSLCPYCAAPLELGGRAGGDDGESPNAGRIAKVEASDKFAGVIEMTPAESLAHHRATLHIRRGRALSLVGLLAVGLGSFLLEAPLYAQAPGLLGTALVFWGLSKVIKGRKACAEATKWPLLKRAAMIRERRSETNLEGMGGHTIYYFEIEFGDGTVVEFAYPGNGSGEDLYTNGLTGVAFTRGQQLLLFQQVRV